MSDDPESASSSDAGEFKYDVAFSFLAQDESLATQLNDALNGRVSTFIYSRRQEELAGTDGMETFARVFGDESRAVVVLYRNGWGERGWTMIERKAIQDRTLARGWDFLLVIPLDQPAQAPLWLPKSRLWFELARWGIPAACATSWSRGVC